MTEDVSIQIEVTGMNRKGWGTGCYPQNNGTSCHVEVVGGLPGDLLEVKLWKKRRRQWQGTALNVLDPSPLRTTPRCAHVPGCGGCTWQQMTYSEQLKEKEHRLNKTFSDLSEITILPIIGCEDPWHYRNKMEFSFSQNRAGERFLGLVLAGSSGRHVLQLTECHLVSPWVASVVRAVRAWWEESGLSAYRAKDDTGVLRTLTVREAKRTCGKLVMLTVSGNPHFALSKSQLVAFVDSVKRSVPDKEWAGLSVFIRVQQLCSGQPTQFYEMHCFGPTHLHEQLFIPPRHFDFYISPSSFFQPNTLQAERLYQEALGYPTFPKRHILDLYAGTATLGMIFAQCADRVTSIELNAHACCDAEENRVRNGVDNLEILCGDVGQVLQALKEKEGFVPPDLAIVDPPRAGLDPLAMATLKGLATPEILYISCNPDTQAANLKEFIGCGYRVKHVQPIDQFPHTPHLETIALLDRLHH